MVSAGPTSTSSTSIRFLPHDFTRFFLTYSFRLLPSHLCRNFLLRRCLPSLLVPILPHFLLRFQRPRYRIHSLSRHNRSHTRTRCYHSSGVLFVVVAIQNNNCWNFSRVRVKSYRKCGFSDVQWGLCPRKRATLCGKASGFSDESVMFSIELPSFRQPRRTQLSTLHYVKLQEHHSSFRDKMLMLLFSIGTNYNRPFP